MHLIEKIRQLTDTVRAASDPATVKGDWELAGRLLSRMPGDQAEVSRVITARDGDGLEAIVARIENPAPVAPKEEGPAVSEEEMNKALKAFKKRLKLARLSDESKLGGRNLTNGKLSQIDAIQPPNDFEPHVWRALADAGKLKPVGPGFYGLV